jgi:hypothetical protein
MCGNPHAGELISTVGMPEGLATCIINRFQDHPMRRTATGTESAIETSLRVVEILPDGQRQGTFRGSTICDDIEREPTHALSVILGGGGSATSEARVDGAE